ncbi:MAG: hypothetical protein QM733_00525 [Ilumatobacteraceae bacterium]
MRIRFGSRSVLAGDVLDAWRHRRREQDGLALRGEAAEDRLDVFGEAHVEHLVGLVEHGELHRADVERLALQVVLDAARRADDDVDALRQRVQLALDRLAAVERDDACPEAAAVAVDRLRHLDRQLTGGHQDDGHRPAAARGVGEALEDRQGERRRLARAGGGLSEQVVAGQQLRDGLGLDRRRLLVAECGEGVGQLRIESERGEFGDLGHATVQDAVTCPRTCSRPHGRRWSAPGCSRPHGRRWSASLPPEPTPLVRLRAGISRVLR